MWCVCVPTIMICKSGLLSIRGGLWVAVGMYRRETYCDILKKEIVYFIKREREREMSIVCACARVSFNSVCQCDPLAVNILFLPQQPVSSLQLDIDNEEAVLKEFTATKVGR